MKRENHLLLSRGPRAVIAAALIMYTILTLIPFYFLALRAAIPTTKSTQVHYWFPQGEEVNLNLTYGALGTYFQLDMRKFNQTHGITEIVSPNRKLVDVAEEFGIDTEELKAYLRPYMTYRGWIALLTNSQFLRSLLVTIILASSSAVTTAILSVFTGSVLGGLRNRWHRAVYYSYLFQIIIPPIMIILPLYILLGIRLGLANTYLSVFLLFIKGGAVSTMIFTAYVGSIPRELKESVDVDGGSRPTYLFAILFPLCKVPIATFMVIYLPRYWNDLLLARVFLKADQLTLVAFIDSFRGHYTTNFQALYAGVIISIVPMVLLYLIFQKLFVRSALSGAVKE